MGTRIVNEEPGRPWQRVAELALRRPAAAWIIAVAYALIAGHAVFADTYLNDEGLLAWFMARAASEEPAATIFWLKSRPTLAAAYAPFAAAGLTPYLVAHVVVAALSAPLIAGIGRAFGLRWPNLPALLVAASPLMLAGGAAGINNTDAVTGVLLAVWLFVARKQPFAAGAVTGALVFARYELVIFAVAMCVHVLVTRKHLRFILGVAIVPILMLVAGAIYHHDPLWPLAFPPALPEAVSPYFRLRGFGVSIGETTGSLLAVTPAIGLVFLLRARTIHGLERTLAIFAVLYLLFIRGTPHVGWFNFDMASRYLLPVLPFVALIVGRVVGDWREDGGENPFAPGWLLALLTLGHVADIDGAPALIWAVVVWAAMLVAARGGAPLIAAGMMAVGVIASAPLLLGATQLEVDHRTPGLRPLTAWLATERPAAVLTNVHLLGTWLDRSGDLPEVEVSYVVQSDQLLELTRLTNAEVGQTDAIRRALAGGFYGEPVYPSELRWGALPDGTVVAVDPDDPRLQSWLPDDLWDRRLRTVAEGPGWRVGRPVAEVAP